MCEGSLNKSALESNLKVWCRFSDGYLYSTDINIRDFWNTTERGDRKPTKGGLIAGVMRDSGGFVL